MENNTEGIHQLKKLPAEHGGYDRYVCKLCGLETSHGVDHLTKTKCFGTKKFSEAVRKANSRKNVFKHDPHILRINVTEDYKMQWQERLGGNANSQGSSKWQNFRDIVAIQLKRDCSIVIWTENEVIVIPGTKSNVIKMAINPPKSAIRF